MLARSMLGALAGAAGTVALDVTTYADMALRGRAPSSMTRTVVQKIAERLDIKELADADPREDVKNRQDAIGALLGYATGLGIGILYGLGRPSVRWVPMPLAGLLTGAAAMAATDITAVKLGATDIAQWDTSAWLSDAIPHAVYGLVVAYVYAAGENG
jgi:hypothetical protein